MIRIAAVGDIHLGHDSHGTLNPHFAGLADVADVLLLAGDLTRHGRPQEAAVVASELATVDIPVVAVLGNHDYHDDRTDEVTATLSAAGITVLEGDTTVLDVAGQKLGIAGIKGFGGGFAGACGSEFGEREMKAFVRHAKHVSAQLRQALDTLRTLDCDRRVALLHYSPVPDTLAGEPLEIFPFLGSFLLAEAVDGGGADLVLHGHAHFGSEKGATAGGIPVRNVAQPVIGKAFALYCLDASPGGTALPAPGTPAPQTHP